MSARHSNKVYESARPACPYCGHLHGPDLFLEDHERDLECSGCGRVFLCERVVDVTYTSTRLAGCAQCGRSNVELRSDGTLKQHSRQPVEGELTLKTCTGFVPGPIPKGERRE